MDHDTRQVEIRNYRPQDLPALVEMINAADAHDRLERATTLAAMEHAMVEPGYYPATDCFLAWHGDRLVGAADLVLRQGDEQSTCFAWGVVHPEWRRRGLGTRLMAAVERRCVERLPEVERGAVYLGAGGYDREVGRHALFESLGMERVRYFVNMARPLNGDLPPVKVPAGYRLRPFSQERDAEKMWLVIETAFADHWNYTKDTYEEFAHHIYERPDFQPELVVVAEEEASGEMVAACYNRIDPDWIAQTGRREGYVAALGVLREARRCGLGTALLAESLRMLRSAGMEAAHLGADAENLTGAVRIYERLGFAVRKQSVAYHKLLRAA